MVAINLYRESAIGLIETTAKFFQDHTGPMIDAVESLAGKKVDFRHHEEQAEIVRKKLREELTLLVTVINRSWAGCEKSIGNYKFLTDIMKLHPDPTKGIAYLARRERNEDLERGAPRDNQNLLRIGASHSLPRLSLNADWQTFRVVQACLRGTLVEEIASDRERAQKDPATVIDLAKKAAERTLIGVDVSDGALIFALTLR